MDCSIGGAGAASLTSFCEYRRRLYSCFVRGGDALMNAVDALLTESGARSFAELSLSPFFVRRWSSLYEAFDDATIDRPALQALFTDQARQQHIGVPGRLLLAADASSIVRRESRCARDRSYVHVPNLPEGAKPVAPGWQFAAVVALPEQSSSWTTILDNRRIHSDQTASQVVAQQLRELSPQLPDETIVTCDGGFGNPAFLSQVQDVSMDLLLRTANNRTLYRPAPGRTGRRGAPRKDGDAFVMRDSATHGAPFSNWSGTDERGDEMTVTAWDHLHFKKCRSAEVTLIRIQRMGNKEVKDVKREPPVLWLLWQGAQMPPLSDIPRLYRMRYCIEHSFRFDKQQLLWEGPRLRTPEKFETWTWAVCAVHNLITRAHSLPDMAQAVRRPWETNTREPTPQQVRRACARIIAQLGTPAAPPRVRGKSPGRAKGAKPKRAQRFPTVFKQIKKEPKIV